MHAQMRVGNFLGRTNNVLQPLHLLLKPVMIVHLQYAKQAKPRKSSKISDSQILGKIFSKLTQSESPFGSHLKVSWLHKFGIFFTYAWAFAFVQFNYWQFNVILSIKPLISYFTSRCLTSMFQVLFVCNDQLATMQQTGQNKWKCGSIFHTIICIIFCMIFL